MTSTRNSSGVPTRHRGFIWSKILDALVGSPAQGDILYRGASGWQRLAAGTSGHFLKTNGAGADPAWVSITSTTGLMTFVGSTTVTGAAATDITLGSISLDTYGVFYFEIALDNGSVSTTNISLYYNSDTTATNYHEERITSSAGSGGSTGGNDSILAAPTTGQSFTAHGWIRRNFDGFPRCNFSSTRGAASSRVINTGWHFYDTNTNVTGITVRSSVASALSIGSYIKVWGISTS